MPTRTRNRPGRKALFRGKVRAEPVTVTLTERHHRKVRDNMKRLGLTRADLIALLIDRYADSVMVERSAPSAYGRLRLAIEELGGSLEHVRKGEPQGGSWVLALSTKRLRMPSQQSRTYPDLDRCYRLKKESENTGTWDDRSQEMDPAGLGELFTRLASMPDER